MIKLILAWNVRSVVIMEWKQRHLAAVAVMMVVWLLGCAARLSTRSTMAETDPYATNPNERDPRAHPMAKRNGPGATPDDVAAEFKELKRPIIVRYVRYSGQTIAEARMGKNPDYKHIVLSDEACDFINRRTFDELAIGLGPVIPDPYWNGDAVAVIAVAFHSQLHLGAMLADQSYSSPDDPGTWPYCVRKYPGDIPWFITCTGATVALNIYDGTIIHRTQMQSDEGMRYDELMKKHGLP